MELEVHGERVDSKKHRNPDKSVGHRQNHDSGTIGDSDRISDEEKERPPGILTRWNGFRKASLNYAFEISLILLEQACAVRERADEPARQVVQPHEECSLCQHMDERREHDEQPRDPIKNGAMEVLGEDIEQVGDEVCSCNGEEEDQLDVATNVGVGVDDYHHDE